MAVRDHLPSIHKQKVRIVTVSPQGMGPNDRRRIEAVGKDGAVIQIALHDLPAGFRWPKEGEFWSVVREGLYWYLRAPFQDVDARIKIEDLNPGDQLTGGGEGTKFIIDADEIETDGDLRVKGVKLNPSFVTALPTTPANGDEIYYQSAEMATDGIVWHLRYRSNSVSAYKWEFVGGVPWTAEIDTNEVRIGTDYGDLTTVGPSRTVPLAGDYIIELGAHLYGQANTMEIYMSFAVGGTAASDNDSIEHNMGTAYEVTTAARRRRKNAITASSAIVAKYRTNNGTFNGGWFRRWLSVLPIRVG